MTRALLVALALLVGEAAVRAEDPAHALLDRYVGQWHTTLVLGDFKGIGVASCGWSDDKSALLGREKLFALDLSNPWSGQPWNGRWVMRRVGQSSALRMNYCTADGPQFEDEFTVTKEGPAITGRGKRLIYEVNGKAHSGEFLVESRDEDHITLKMAGGKMGDVKNPGFVLRMTRVQHGEPVK